MRTPLDALLTEKSLQFVSIHKNSDLLEGLNLIPMLEEAGELKNVCAKVSAGLSDEIDRVCGLLHIHKRRFLEAAMIEALNKAKQIMEAEGVWESCDQFVDEQLVDGQAEKQV
jgi:hypothetical protein